MMALDIDPRLIDLAMEIARRGGRAVLVGGWVRDRILGLGSKDFDVEVFGLTAERLEEVLAARGSVIAVGRSFGVYKVKGLDADFSLPRRDSKVSPGHRGFAVRFDPDLDFEAASRRRDFTINSIGLDPLTGEVLDPHGGREDLDRRRLRATDPSHFAEDPLRGLRAAQFIGRFGLSPTPELVGLCRGLDLGELPGERMLEEMRKLLLHAPRPSLGLVFLKASDLLRFLPELDRLVGSPAGETTRPGGDAWTHTLMVVDAAAALYSGARDETVMFAALCHDLGTAAIAREADHDIAGVTPTRHLLARLRVPERIVDAVSALVAEHLAPPRLAAAAAPASAYRRLARRLEAGGAEISQLETLARAGQIGRATGDAGTGRDSWEATFHAGAEAALVALRAPPPAVGGRHLVARGLTPGPEFSRIIAACQERQDETGESDPQRILDAVLGAKPHAPPRE